VPSWLNPPLSGISCTKHGTVYSEGTNLIQVRRAPGNAECVSSQDVLVVTFLRLLKQDGQRGSQGAP
jgi:hypothetical protein